MLFLIPDPFFCAMAVPAVLMLGISKSGFGAGFCSLAVSLIALAIPVPQAAAILMPLLLVMGLLSTLLFLQQHLLLPHPARRRAGWGRC